jgi:hypothetical protein
MGSSLNFFLILLVVVVVVEEEDEAVEAGVGTDGPLPICALEAAGAGGSMSIFRRVAWLTSRQGERNVHERHRGDDEWWSVGDR